MKKNSLNDFKKYIESCKINGDNYSKIIGEGCVSLIRKSSLLSIFGYCLLEAYLPSSWFLIFANIISRYI